MKQKLLSTRNVALAIWLVLLALCLAVGIFILPNKANAAEDTPDVVPATVNLADYSNLSWRLTGVGNTVVDTELLSGNGMTLYIYTYTDEDGNEHEYPTNSILTSEQIENLNLNPDYTTRTVLYSAVRNRNETVTITIGNNAAYTVKYDPFSNLGSRVGTYTTVATLTATDNYTFTAGNVNAMRGMKVEISEDGKTATVTKTWYIVEMSNWLVSSTGAEYTIPNHTYGDSTNASAPTTYYTGEGGTISMTLYLNGTKIGDSFGTADFSKYICSVMPAGNYTLTVMVEGVYATEHIDHTEDDEIGHTNCPVVYHGGFTETIEFTVHKAALPDLTALNAALKGQTFTYLMDGNDHLYGDNSIVNNYLAQLANTGRAGTVWFDYNDLYGSFAITYNLARNQNDVYSATVRTRDADTYTVYYRISALNYYSSTENLTDETRWDYYFYVVNVAEVSIPELESKIYYDGNLLTADISGSQYFEIIENEGGIDVGAYDVKLRLLDSEHYMWAGSTLENRTPQITVKFNITEADNQWTVSPTVIAWKFNGYDIDTNLIMGSVIGGTVTFSVSKDGTVVEGLESFTSVDDTIAGVLTELPAGGYTLTATVTPDGNHKSMDALTVPFEVSKAVNDWQVPFDVIGWAYGSYDRDTNLILGSVISGTVTFSVEKMFGSVVKGLESFTTVDDTIASILMGLDAGDYTVTATVEVDGNYEEVNSGVATLTVAKAVNSWVVTPGIVAWVKGQYNAEENVITVSDMFNGEVDIVIFQSDNEENVIYQTFGGEVVIDNLAGAAVGHYTLKAVVNETVNYGGLEKTFTFQIFAPEGLAWWAWLLIIIGILGVIALVFWILHEKGIFQMLTGKFVIAMRTKMTVDATIAAVRANMVAENSRKTRAEAERRDRLEALRKAREEGNTMTAEEQAAALEEQARVAAEKAEKMQKRADRIQKRAEKARSKAETAAQPEETQTTAEDVTPETTDEGDTPDEN